MYLEPLAGPKLWLNTLTILTPTEEVKVLITSLIFPMTVRFINSLHVANYAWMFRSNSNSTCSKSKSYFLKYLFCSTRHVSTISLLLPLDLRKLILTFVTTFVHCHSPCFLHSQQILSVLFSYHCFSSGPKNLFPELHTGLMSIPNTTAYAQGSQIVTCFFFFLA